MVEVAEFNKMTSIFVNKFWTGFYNLYCGLADSICSG